MKVEDFYYSLHTNIIYISVSFLTYNSTDNTNLWSINYKDIEKLCIILCALIKCCKRGYKIVLQSVADRRQLLKNKLGTFFPNSLHDTYFSEIFSQLSVSGKQTLLVSFNNPKSFKLHCNPSCFSYILFFMQLITIIRFQSSIK